MQRRFQGYVKKLFIFNEKKTHKKNYFFDFLWAKFLGMECLKVIRLCLIYFSYFYFLRLNERTFETRRNPYYFTSKGPMVLEILKFQNFRILNFIKPSNALVRNNQYLLLNSFGSKHSLVMKFGQFI